MDLSQRKEQLCQAYIRAVASVAGYAVYKPEVDDDSVDVGFAQRGGGGTVRSPRLEAQLKCTSQDVLSCHHLNYPLKMKNYNDLRGFDLLVPRILIVVVVPITLADWLLHSEDNLVIRHCGYWFSLRHELERDNTASVTLAIPRQQVFTVESLKRLMDVIKAGGAP